VGADLLPSVELVVPHFDPVAAGSIGVPLFLVTMTSQNIAGPAVLGSFGYHPPLSRRGGRKVVHGAFGPLSGAVTAIAQAAPSGLLGAGVPRAVPVGPSVR